MKWKSSLEELNINNYNHMETCIIFKRLLSRLGLGLEFKQLKMNSPHYRIEI